MHEDMIYCDKIVKYFPAIKVTSLIGINIDLSVDLAACNVLYCIDVLGTVGGEWRRYMVK